MKDISEVKEQIKKSVLKARGYLDRALEDDAFQEIVDSGDIDVSYFYSDTDSSWTEMVIQSILLSLVPEGIRQLYLDSSGKSKIRIYYETSSPYGHTYIRVNVPDNKTLLSEMSGDWVYDNWREICGFFESKEAQDRIKYAVMSIEQKFSNI